MLHPPLLSLHPPLLLHSLHHVTLVTLHPLLSSLRPSPHHLLRRSVGSAAAVIIISPLLLLLLLLLLLRLQTQHRTAPTAG